ncbi:MAG: RNase adapter RapZ [Deinococcales bacterium]
MSGIMTHGVNMNIVIISGRSGAGKSTALRALEDIGYFAVDNLPPGLWPALSELYKQDRLAIGIDVRAKEFLGAVPEAILKLRGGHRLELVYLDASDETLLQRYNFTRRVHPLPLGSLLQGLKEEKELLVPLKGMAQWVLDTSDYSAKRLASEIQQHFQHSNMFQLRLISFGFKHGAPTDADNIFDLRAMPNPFYDLTLRPLDGRDKAVSDYVFGQGARSKVSGEELYLSLRDFALKLIKAAKQADRLSYSLALGCTGGKHRSVAVTERLNRELGEYLADEHIRIQPFHRDLINVHGLAVHGLGLSDQPLAAHEFAEQE